LKKVIKFKPEDKCILVKVWVKLGSVSKKSIKGQEITLSNPPVLGEPLMIIREGESLFTTEDGEEVRKRSRHPIMSMVVGLKNIPGVGLRIETETSIFLLLKKEED